MIYPDTLVHLETYPDPVEDSAAETAAAWAAVLGGQATVVSPFVRIPMKSNRIASFALNLGELARTEEARAREHAERLAGVFRQALETRGGAATSLHPVCELFEIGDVTARMARTHDVTLLPYGKPGGAQMATAEALLFASGRPSLLIPARGDGQAAALNHVLIAWDGGAPAARAVAASLPMLKAAGKVTILSVLNEKAGISEDQAAALGRHLARHGVTSEVHGFDAAGARIGSVFEHVCTRLSADVLVMGAFGHSRAREFVLGGATQSVIQAPPVPVLLAH